MPTGTLNGVGREYPWTNTHILKRDINFASPASFRIGTLPMNAVVLRCTVFVKTAFNAGTTNTINVGTGASATAFGSGLAAGAVGAVAGTIVAAQAVPTADTDVIASYAQTGAVATAGVASVILEYAPSHDG